MSVPQPLTKIISGGQTGADQAGLRAGRALGLKTGGWMPKSFRTDTGSNPLLAKEFGLQEHSDYSYPPRTKLNVRASDGTIVMGNPTSPGCVLTINLCKAFGRPCLIYVTNRDEPEVIRQFITWNRIQTLNVAGNREERNPGIGQWAEQELIGALS